MADISIVGVRLVVEGSEESVGKIAAVDTAAKSMGGSLRDVSGQETTGGLSRLLISIDDVGTGMDRASGKASGFHGVLRDLDGTLSNLSGSMMRFTALGIGGAALGLAGLATAVVGFGVKSAASFQQTKVSFDLMLGSVAAGNDLFKKLQQFNFQSPFQLPDITKAAQTLLQYGFTGQNVMPVVKTLANVASAAPAGEQSDDLARSALALGQISAAGVIRGQDVNQLTQAGFPIIKLLAEATGQTSEALAKQLRGGGITLPASTLVSAVAAGTGTTLTPYAHAAQAQNATLPGQWSNLVDTLRMDAATASQPLADVLTKNMPQITTALNDVLSRITPQLNTFFTTLAQNAPGAIEKVGPALTGLLNGLQQNGPMIMTFLHDLGSLLPDLVKVGGDLLPIIDGMARGFHDLLSLPFGIGTGLVAGLLVALTGYNAIKGTVEVITGLGTAFRWLAGGEEAAAAASKGGGLASLLGFAEAAGPLAILATLGAEGVKGVSAADSPGGLAQRKIIEHNQIQAHHGGALSGVNAWLKVAESQGVGSLPLIGAPIRHALGADSAGNFRTTNIHPGAIVVNNPHDSAATVREIDQYLRDMNRRAGVPATS